MRYDAGYMVVRWCQDGVYDGGVVITFFGTPKFLFSVHFIYILVLVIYRREELMKKIVFNLIFIRQPLQRR